MTRIPADMSDFESKHPRKSDGKFAEKQQSEPDILSLSAHYAESRDALNQGLIQAITEETRAAYPNATTIVIAVDSDDDSILGVEEIRTGNLQEANSYFGDKGELFQRLDFYVRNLRERETIVGIMRVGGHWDSVRSEILTLPKE